MRSWRCSGFESGAIEASNRERRRHYFSGRAFWLKVPPDVPRPVTAAQWQEPNQTAGCDSPARPPGAPAWCGWIGPPHAGQTAYFLSQVLNSASWSLKKSTDLGVVVTVESKFTSVTTNRTGQSNGLEIE
jgi:hypothetical protein